MAIGEQVHSDADATSPTPAGTTPAPAGSTTRHQPHYIQTWPFTTADLDGNTEDSDTTDATGNEIDRVDDEVELEPELVIAATVKQWPEWLQRQWRQNQRRRL